MRLVMVARNLREWAAWQAERQRLLTIRHDPDALVPRPIVDRLLAEADRRIHELEVTA